MHRRPRVLFVCPRHPYPPHRGDQVRAYHLSRCLAEHADVRLVCFATQSDGLRVPGVEVRPVEFSIGGRVRANLRRPSPLLPVQVRAFLDRGMDRAIADELEHWEPDVVHITLSRMAPYMAPAHCHRHVDFVDSMALNMRGRAAASGFLSRVVFAVESRLAGRFEARVAAQADSASVVAKLDQAEPGLESALVVPNGVDRSSFPYRDPDVRPPRIVFFGNLGYFHNVEPAEFLVGQVLDRVREELPQAQLRLAGARPSARVRQLARRDDVELVADPPAMAPLLHSAAVVAIPMFSGSGIKNKVLEAFSAGTPVVANAAAIEGIDGAVPGEHFVLAEGPDETAKAITELIGDPGKRVRLARAAQLIVAASYSWEQQATRMMAAYGLPVAAGSSSAD